MRDRQVRALLQNVLRVMVGCKAQLYSLRPKSNSIPMPLSLSRVSNRTPGDMALSALASSPSLQKASRETTNLAESRV
jgi:hypothetical protein